MSTILIALLCICLSASFVQAESVGSAVLAKQIEELYINSDGIYISEFKRFDKKKTIGPTSQLTAIYRYTQILKGPPFGTTMRIRFDREQNSKKSNSIQTQLPKKNSKWIIFIRKLPSTIPWVTTQGSKGRVKYTEENLDALLKIIDKHKLKSKRPIDLELLKVEPSQKHIPTIGEFLDGRSNVYYGYDARAERHHKSGLAR